MRFPKHSGTPGNGPAIEHNLNRMRPRKSRRSHRRIARAQRVRFLAGLITVALLIVAAAIVGEKNHRSRRPKVSDAATQADAANPGATLVGSAAERQVYPYSIIEGGATTAEELMQAVQSDPVVARHFAKFDLPKTRVETLRAPRLVHVSYRRGDDVFWTRRKVVIPAGETVLTDGTNYARTRCGNCLSETAGPVSADEPAAAVLDTPVSVSELKLAQRSLTGTPIQPMAAPAAVGSLASSGFTSPTGGGIGGPIGGGVRGSSSSPVPGSSAAGRQPGGNEKGDPANALAVDPAGGSGSSGRGTPGGPGSGSQGNSGGPGNSGSPGNSGGSVNSGAPANFGAPGTPGGPGAAGGPGTAGGPGGGPGNPPGAPGGPQPPVSVNIPLAPPSDPGDPILPSIDTVLPPGDDPLSPQIEEQTLPQGGDPGHPGEPGDPGFKNEQPLESIPEPGTTALMLLGGAYALRRLRRTVP